MNKKGEAGLGESLMTVVQVLGTILVLVSLFALASTLYGSWNVDKQDATMRNFDRLVQTINGMEDGDLYTDYDVYVDKESTIVGWPSGMNANTGVCSYVEGLDILLQGLPKPPACGSGDQGCLCLCENGLYDDLCQGEDTIKKCTTTDDFDDDLSFVGCISGTCDFALLLGNDASVPIHLRRAGDTIELNFKGCAVDNRFDDTRVASTTDLSYSGVSGKQLASLMQDLSKSGEKLTAADDHRWCSCGENCEEYATEIMNNAATYSIDPLLLLSVMMVESSCQQTIKDSTSDCVGAMQICSWKMCQNELGLTKHWDLKYEENYQDNIACGAHILHTYYEKGQEKYPDGLAFECIEGLVYSDWEYALREYNGWVSGSACQKEGNIAQFKYVDKVVEINSQLKERLAGVVVS
jgi:hypothetical protein